MDGVSSDETRSPRTLLFPFVDPGSVSRCTWTKETPEANSPHRHEAYPSKTVSKILPNILGHVGGTPMVRLNRIGKNDGLQCELLAKCEFFNAGGSVKDRIAVRMVEEAERDGRLKKGMTIIEPTSGNTGIGLALVAVVKGYGCIVVMSEKMSQEKVSTLHALGARIVRTPIGVRYDSPESVFGVAHRLLNTIPNSIILDQHMNVGNPIAHYDQTAEEILYQCDGKLDMVVVGAGTGGTLTGIGRKLKEKCPECVIVGNDPVGSIFAQPETLNNAETTFYEVEGLGDEFIPTVLDRNFFCGYFDFKIVDKWVKTDDKSSLLMARRLIREEGLLCGGSSGANVYAALQAAKDLKAGQRCVVILPDGVRNYMTKFLNDDWMAERAFVDVDDDVIAEKHWWWNLPVRELTLRTPVCVASNARCQDTIEIMKREGVEQLPVLDDHSSLIGVVTIGNLMSRLVTKALSNDTTVVSAMSNQFKKVNLETSLGKLSRILDKDRFAVVVRRQEQFVDKVSSTAFEHVVGVASRIDLLNHVNRRTS